MKKLLLIILCLCVLPVMLFAWTATSGSTSPTAADDWNVDDIWNDVHDETHKAITTYNVSTGAYHSRMWVWDSDFEDWRELTISSTNADDVNVTTGALSTKSFLYGYNGTGWDRLKSDVEHFLYVRTSTESIIRSITYPVTSYITNSQFDELSMNATTYINTNQFNEITQNSTYYLNIVQFEEITQNATSYVYIEKNHLTELTANSTNYINVNQFNELTRNSTFYLNVNQFLSLMEDTSVYAYIDDAQLSALLEDSSTYAYIDDTQYVELTQNSTFYLTESQLLNLLEDTTSYVFIDDAQYVELTQNSTFYLNVNQFADLRVVRNWRGTNSTGTVLNVTNGATATYTPNSGVIEIWVDSIDDNTDTVRFRFFDDDIVVAGTPIYAGTGKIIDNWNGTIHFRSETGTQKIIINEIYE